MLTSTVLIWLFLSTLAWAVLITVQHIRTRRPFPLDQGFRIFPCRDEEALRLMLGIAGSCGLRIKRQINTPAIKRVLMSDGMTVFNVINDADLRQKTRQRPAIALVASDPIRAAEEAAILSRGYGYPASVLGELDPDAGPGNLVFIETELLPGQLLVFRKHVKDMLLPGVK